MASLVPYSGPKLRKPNLLKDFLLDDFSSCSSNGFRSFPRRRQCCTTTVRILLDLDHLAKKKHKNHHQIPPPTQKSSSPPKTMLQRASTAVYRAVKKLPFASAVKPRRAILPRSISRKLFKRSFWKKCDRKEIARWNTFHTVVENKSEPSVYSPVKLKTNTASENKKSYGSSTVSWTESDFTSSSSCTSGNYSGTVNSSENEVVKNSEQVVKMGKRVGVIVGEAVTSSDANCVVDSPKQKQWPNQENKEQFSPVSVLDCPFDNDDVVEEEDEVSSAFKHKRAPAAEGTYHKLNKNLRRLESLSKLEPVALEKRIALAEFDNESVGSPLASIQENLVSDNEEGYNKSGKKSEELLEQMKARTPSSTSLVLNSDNLFLDFFIEATCEDNKVSDCELLDLAKDWINGQPQEVLLGWQVQKNREVYIREMEKGGIWGKLDEYRQQVALELEAEIFTSLVNDLFVI